MTLIKYMGAADYREFFAGDTLNGQAPATPVNIIFSRDTAIDPGDHIVDTTGAFYSGVNATWWTKLLNDPLFLNVTGMSPAPAGLWDSLYGFQELPVISPDGDIPLAQKGVAGGVASLDGTGNVPLSQLANAPSGGGGGAPSGPAGGDLGNTYPNPSVIAVRGVTLTTAIAQLIAQLNGAVVRTTTSTLAAGESTVFSGSTAAQTLTLPDSTTQASTPNAMVNDASVPVTVQPGSGTTINNMGVTGNITLQPGQALRLILVGTVWYVFVTANTNAGGDLVGTYPNPTVAKLNGISAASYALLASPAFTGNPTATTQAGADNSTRLATTAFVQTAAGLLLPLTGGTMSGNIAMGSHSITGLAAPVNPGDAVTKAYADALTSGLSTHPAAQWATAAALPAVTYNNGAGTLTATANGAIAVDGGSPALNDRIVVKDQASQFQNGIYTVTTVGTGSVPFVLTRATDMNTPAQVPGAYVFIEEGATNAAAGFVVASPGPFTLGTTAIVFTQFSGAGSVLAGTGLSKVGNTINLATPVSAANGGTGQSSLGAVTISAFGAPTADVGWGAKKITNLANGVAASDAATIGQLPATLPPNGAASGDLGGTYPSPSVDAVKGVVQTAATATLMSQMNNAIVRTASAAVQAGEETVFSGTAASQTMTLPGSSAQTSSINVIANISTQSVTIAPGTGTTLSKNGTLGNIIVQPGYSCEVVLIGSVWYVINFGPLDGGTSKTYADTKVPALGVKLVAMGHSLMTGYGAIPTTHGFMSQVAGMLRARLWNQAVNGARLAGIYATGGNGFGGIPQILQSFQPPKQPIQWQGAYSAGGYYHMDDGVTASTTVATCTTTNGSPNVSTTASFATFPVVQGMVATGAGIPLGTYVKSVSSATNLVLSQNANATGTVTLTFVGWYRAFQSVHGTTPTGAGDGTHWNLVQAGNDGIFGSPYNSQPSLPLLMYGNNDIVWQAQRNPQPFLSALQAAFARLACALLWEDTSPMITLAGGTWTPTTYASIGGAFGSGSGVTAVPNTAGATISFQTPPDWTGGFVDIGFLCSFLNGAVGTAPGLCTGTLGFTVDGVNVNCKCSGQADGPSVNFGNPVRNVQTSAALGAALTNGVSSGATLTTEQGLPFSVPSTGLSVVVGGVGGGSSQTFTTTGTAAQGATSIPITAANANANYPVGTPVTVLGNSWTQANDVVVRVPVPSGSHQVTVTVPASPNIANLYFDYVSFESAQQPVGLVFGLWKGINMLGMGGSQPGFQDVDTWNAALQGVIGPGNEWPHIYINTADIFCNSSTLSTGLTAGQTNISSLALNAPGLLVPIATGDYVQVGSGASAQLVQATAPAAVGALSVSVTTFTSTFAQPIGSPVFDWTTAAQYFYQDGVHPNLTGHSLIASLVWANLLAAVPQAPQLTAQQSEEAGRPSSIQNLTGAADLVVGSATVAGSWVSVNNVATQVPADAGDLIELTLNALWDTSATTAGFLDIVTGDTPALLLGEAFPAWVTNYVSGMKSIGGGATQPSVHFDAVGAQATNGLPSLSSAGAAATVTDQATGKFYYVAQQADIFNGVIGFGLLGKSSTTTVRHLKNAAGFPVHFSAVNLGPVSYAGEA